MLLQQQTLETSLALHVPSLALNNCGKHLLLILQEQQAEAARIAAERTRLQQEQAAAARLHSEQKKKMREDQLRQKQLQQVMLTCMLGNIHVHCTA